MATPGEPRLFDARVSLTKEMLKRLWAAYEMFNGVRSDGGRPSGGLRDFTRTFVDESRKENNWGAYVRTMIKLGAQGSIDAFVKAAQHSRSAGSIVKAIRALSTKSKNEIEELR